MKQNFFMKHIIVTLSFIVIYFHLSIASGQCEIPSSFIYSYEENTGSSLDGNNSFDHLLFEVKKMGNLTYRFKASLVKATHISNHGKRSNYYETGYPFDMKLPEIFLLNFLEGKTIDFSFDKGKFIMHNFDTLKHEYIRQFETKRLQTDKVYRNKFIKKFNKNYFSLVFSSLIVDIRERSVSPGDYWMQGNDVFYYAETYKNYLNIEINKPRQHEKWVSFVDKQTGFAFYTMINAINGKRVSRIITNQNKSSISYNTIISGENWSKFKGDSIVEFEVDELLMDSSLKNIMCKVDNEGRFNLSLYLNEPAVIKMKKGNVDLYCEPGDDIQLLFSSDNDTVVIKGTACPNNEYLRIKERPLNIQLGVFHGKKMMEKAKVFGLVDEKKQKNLKLLELYKRDISPRFYEHEFIGEHCSAINDKLFVLSRCISYPYEYDPTSFEWAKLPSPYYQTFTFNHEYNNFLAFHIFHELDRLQHFENAALYDVNKLSKRPEFLRLSQMHLQGKQLVDFLGSQARQYFLNNNILMIDVFEDIVSSDFPDSPLASYITILKETSMSTNIGNKFPDLILDDFDNKKKKLPVGKGRPVYLMIWRNDAFIINRDWHQYQGVVEKSVGNNIEFINIGVDSNFDIWKEQVKTVPFLGKNYFLSEESELYKKYFSNLKSRHYFLLDNNGMILNNNGPEPFGALDEFSKIINNHPNRKSLILGGLISLLGVGLIAFLVIVIIRNNEKRKAKIGAMKNKLREVEMKAIKAQMNPHFLFNSLNSIQSMINQNKVENANVYLSKFASLLRGVLKNSDLEFIPLHEEIENVKLYCELEKLRFNFNLSFKVDSSVDLFNTLFPPLLMQPFIENAIIHGLHPKEGEKLLEVEIKDIDEKIVCIIRDNGVGRGNTTRSKLNNGIGVKLSKERIEILNDKNKCNFKIDTVDLQDNSCNSLGTEVVISFSNILN